MRVKVKFVDEILPLLKCARTALQIPIALQSTAILAITAVSHGLHQRGLLANMLMKTNGGNLSVLGMSLACRGGEMQWHKKKKKSRESDI